MEGTEEQISRVRELAAQFIDAAAEGMYEWGNEIVKPASQELTPVKTTNLLQSAYCDDPELDGTKITLELGHRAEYAVYVHENLEAHHDIGQARFLETALIMSMPEFYPTILRHLEAKMGGD